MVNLYTDYYKQYPDKFLEEFFGIKLSLWQKFIIRRAFAELDASDAKKLGRQVPLRGDWEEVKDNIMYEICKAKFTQNEDLKEKLLATGNDILEEGNTWGDRVWGTVNGVGENRLGKILMRVREELRNE